mmetsp:Transcript_91552/g.144684  ORF Transcript_91552/g.144684 Transcript_91552/m.144684 type:complete len:252 (+) Transcript_91552:317-1072(+)
MGKASPTISNPKSVLYPFTPAVAAAVITPKPTTEGEPCAKSKRNCCMAAPMGKARQRADAMTKSAPWLPNKSTSDFSGESLSSFNFKPIKRNKTAVCAPASELIAFPTNPKAAKPLPPVAADVARPRINDKEMGSDSNLDTVLPMPPLLSADASSDFSPCIFRRTGITINMYSFIGKSTKPPNPTYSAPTNSPTNGSTDSADAIVDTWKAPVRRSAEVSGLDDLPKTAMAASQLHTYLATTMPAPAATKLN